MKESSAIFTATLLAPIPPALLVGVLTQFEGRIELLTVLGLFPIAYMVGLFITLLVAFPGFWLLRRMGIFRWWSAMMGGLLLGALAAAVIQRPGLTELWNPAGPTGLYGAAGALSGLIFWTVWRLSAPNGTSGTRYPIDTP